jgi:hypothetical protein
MSESVPFVRIKIAPLLLEKLQKELQTALIVDIGGGKKIFQSQISHASAKIWLAEEEKSIFHFST